MAATKKTTTKAEPEVAVGRLLTKRSLTIGVAESCTGGLLSSMITNVPGSSAYFIGSVVVYSNALKTRLAGVKPTTLERHGSVSAETAMELAKGIAAKLKTDVGLAITGIAGPSGGTLEKPVGTVFIAAYARGKIVVKRLAFTGKRESIRKRSAKEALLMLHAMLASRG